MRKILTSYSLRIAFKVTHICERIIVTNVNLKDESKKKKKLIKTIANEIH